MQIDRALLSEHEADLVASITYEATLDIIRRRDLPYLFVGILMSPSVSIGISLTKLAYTDQKANQALRHLQSACVYVTVYTLSSPGRRMHL